MGATVMHGLSRIGLWWCVMLLAPSVSAAPRADASADRSLRWAERLLEKEVHPRDRTHTGWLSGTSTARDAFEAVLRKSRPSARGYLGLAACQQRLGDYAAALSSFEQVVRLAPASAAARRGADAARSSLQIASAVAPQLPQGERLLQVGRLVALPKQELWAVLSAKSAPGRDTFGREYESPHLSLFRRTERGYSEAWQSGALDDPRFKGEHLGWNQIALDVFRYTGQEIPEVSVWKQYIGASASPCHLEVFKLERNRLTRILSATSDEEFRVQDLRRDGRYEVWDEYCIGYELSHAEQHRWNDIYAYDARQGKYVQADRDFPGQFRRHAAEIVQLLRQHRDPQLLEYLGVCREIEGRPGAALQAYREALELCRPGDEGTDPPSGRAVLARRIAGLRARLAERQRH
jgi:tetratricopeptide (TPR) repeat protein